MDQGREADGALCNSSVVFSLYFPLFPTPTSRARAPTKALSFTSSSSPWSIPLLDPPALSRLNHSYLNALMGGPINVVHRREPAPSSTRKLVKNIMTEDAGLLPCGYNDYFTKSESIWNSAKKEKIKKLQAVPRSEINYSILPEARRQRKRQWGLLPIRLTEKAERPK